MSHLSAEAIVDEHLIHDDQGRKIISQVGDSNWGQLILPSKTESINKTEDGFRILIFGSYMLGYLVTETIKEFEKQNPSRLNIVGLVTDDPASPDAKISVKRRVWRMFQEDEIIDIETATIESALKNGTPVYTGAVKTEYFRALLKKWKPDAIIVSVFGQLIDTPIINYPKYGIYNFHPADLLLGFGAGPQPYQDLINRNAKTSKLTIHHLTEDLDQGPILGQSPEVNVGSADGSLSKNILILDDQLMKVGDISAAILVKTLILHKEKGMKGKLQKLNFAKHFSQDVRDMLLKLITATEHSNTLPTISKHVDFSI